MSVLQPNAQFMPAIPAQPHFAQPLAPWQAVAPIRDMPRGGATLTLPAAQRPATSAQDQPRDSGVDQPQWSRSAAQLLRAPAPKAVEAAQPTSVGWILNLVIMSIFIVLSAIVPLQPIAPFLVSIVAVVDQLLIALFTSA